MNQCVCVYGLAVDRPAWLRVFLKLCSRAGPEHQLLNISPLNRDVLCLQISVEFRNLAQEYQDVISDICHRMGVGMAEFLEKKIGSMQEWDKVSLHFHPPKTASLTLRLLLNKYSNEAYFHPNV